MYVPFEIVRDVDGGAPPCSLTTIMPPLQLMFYRYLHRWSAFGDVEFRSAHACDDVAAPCCTGGFDRWSDLAVFLSFSFFFFQGTSPLLKSRILKCESMAARAAIFSRGSFRTSSRVSFERSRPRNVALRPGPEKLKGFVEISPCGN